jgi:hypothetical protein
MRGSNIGRERNNMNNPTTHKYPIDITSVNEPD